VLFGIKSSNAFDVAVQPSAYTQISARLPSFIQGIDKEPLLKGADPIFDEQFNQFLPVNKGDPRLAGRNGFFACSR
jgi:hypothetical protein